MANETSKPRFWTIVAIANVAALAYPINLYLRSDGSNALLFAALVVSVAFVMAVTDVVGAVIGYRE